MARTWGMNRSRSIDKSSVRTNTMFGWRDETTGAVGGEPPTTGGFKLGVGDFEPPPHAASARHASAKSADPSARIADRAFRGLGAGGVKTSIRRNIASFRRCRCGWCSRGGWRDESPLGRARRVFDAAAAPLDLPRHPVYGGCDASVIP